MITYSITIGGCDNTATQIVTVVPDNTITLMTGGSQSACLNTPITTTTYVTTGATGATITGLPTGVTGNWAANVVTISGAPTTTGSFMYSITLTGGCGDVSMTGTIAVDSCIALQIDELYADHDTLCFGDSIQLNVVVSNGHPPYTYTWTGNGLSDESIANPMALPIVGTNIYSVTISDGTSTIDTSISIFVASNPVVAMTYDCNTQTVTALPEGMQEYNFFLNGISAQQGESNTYMSTAIINNDSIMVYLTNKYGCAGSDTLIVDCKVETELPNAFTPNGDGYDDLFPTASYIESVYYLVIFDRWGLKLYEGNSGWDGKYNGKLVPPGTYYYKIIITNPDGSKTDKVGSITLVKN